MWAAELEGKSEALDRALSALAAVAETERAKREVQWRPVARKVEQWVDIEAQARRDAAPVKALKDAGSWLKEQSSVVRERRFAPIAEQRRPPGLTRRM